MTVTEEQCEEIAEDIASYVEAKFTGSADGLYAAEAAYGLHHNAVVTYFPYKESYNCSAETLDQAVERIVKADRIKKHITETLWEKFGTEE